MSDCANVNPRHNDGLNRILVTILSNFIVPPDKSPLIRNPLNGSR